MKVAIDKDNMKIVDILPNNATKEHKFLMINGYLLAEVDEFEVGRELTAEEITSIDRIYGREQRDEAVQNIEVLYNGYVFQGDEVSQSRMARALAGMKEDDTIKWKTKDNLVIVLSKDDLKQVLRLAGQEQTKIWFKE